MKRSKIMWCIRRIVISGVIILFATYGSVHAGWKFGTCEEIRDFLDNEQYVCTPDADASMLGSSAECGCEACAFTQGSTVNGDIYNCYDCFCVGPESDDGDYVLSASMPDYGNLGTPPTLDWNESENRNSVVLSADISSCVKVTPVTVTVVNTGSETDYGVFMVDCANANKEIIGFACTRSAGYAVYAEFDSPFVRVNNSCQSPQCVGGTFTVSVVVPNAGNESSMCGAGSSCEELLMWAQHVAGGPIVRLKYAKQKAVLASGYNEPPETASESTCTFSQNAVSPWMAECEDGKMLGTVNLEFDDSFDDLGGNGNGGNGNGGNGNGGNGNGGNGGFGGGGFGGGGCGGFGGCGFRSNGRILTPLVLLNAHINTASSQAGTQGCYASINGSGDVSVNTAGSWVRADGGSWTVGTINYDQDVSNDITAVNFTVTGPWNEQYYYRYEAPGDPWSDEEEAARASRKKIQLQHVVENGVTKRTYEYDEDSGNVITQHSLNNSEQSNGYIIYDYDDVSVWNSPLRRAWAGTNPAMYAAYGSTPGGGRYVDLNFNSYGRIVHLKKGCSICGTGGEYTFGYQLPVWVSGTGKLLLTEVVDVATSRVLLGRTYNNIGRITKIWRANASESEIMARNKIYIVIDPAVGIVGPQITLRTIAGLSRAAVAAYNATGTSREDIVYLRPQATTVLGLQDLRGAYARRMRDYEFTQSAVAILTKATITSPTGYKRVKFFDATTGRINQVLLYDKTGSNTVTAAQYSYNSSGKVTKIVDDRGGTSEYVYSGDNLVTRIAPDPNPTDTLPYDPGRLTTIYQYDSQDRIIYESRKDSQGPLVATAYEFDGSGNLTLTIEDEGGSELTTAYEYNEYNELTKTIGPGASASQQSVSIKAYSAGGVVTQEAVLVDNQSGALAVGATEYEYDANGWLTRKAVADDSAPFDLGEGPAAWIYEDYLYDSHGRRTAVIADAGGKNLTTTYEYNDQSEITKTIQPDLRYVELKQDGQGRLTQEIVGVNSVSKAATYYHYDQSGNLTRRIDPAGITKVYRYDEYDRLILSRSGQ